MNLIFDLDGTLINSQLRLYKLFQFLVEDSKLSFTEYWELKRNKIDHKNILTNNFCYTNNQFYDFQLKWMEEIEKSEWLAFDHTFDGVLELLEYLSHKNKLHIVTARQDKKKCYDQLRNLGLIDFLTTILVTEQKYDKFELINKNINVISSDWIFGDTGLDILTGKQLGIRTVAVHSGFLSKASLKLYNPDYLFENITDIKHLF